MSRVPTDDVAAFLQLSPTTLADCLSRRQIMNAGIRPMWPDMPRMAGAAYPVRCGPGDNLMLHAAIYRASPGAVIVVEAPDAEYALAGGNVCAVAQQHGIAGFVLDGAVRDIAEIRAMRFPVYAKAVVPKPGTKDYVGSLDLPVTCGGVRVGPGDMVVADEEGIVVVPRDELAAVLSAALRRAAADSAQSLPAWEADHRQRLSDIFKKKGFED